MKDNKCEQCGKEIDYKRFRRKYCIECASKRNRFAFIKKSLIEKGRIFGLKEASDIAQTLTDPEVKQIDSRLLEEAIYKAINNGNKLQPRPN